MPGRNRPKAREKYAPRQFAGHAAAEHASCIEGKSPIHESEFFIEILPVEKETVETRRRCVAWLLQSEECMNPKSLKASILITLLLSILALSACHTVEGAGKDVEKAGQSIQNSAEKHS